MISKLQGKAAIVSRASDGTGAAVAKALAAEGAAVVVGYDGDEMGAKNVVDVICAAGGMATAISGNPAIDADAKRLVREAITAFGRLDILVNPCGSVPFSNIQDFTEERYRSALDANALSVLQMTKAALPSLGKGASIINILSNVVQEKTACSAIAAGSLGAVQAITKVLALELKARTIRMNAILIRESAPSTAQDSEAVVVPSPRTGSNEPANLAVFLASALAESITGELIHVGEMA